MQDFIASGSNPFAEDPQPQKNETVEVREETESVANESIPRTKTYWQTTKKVLKNYGTFVGPGLLISVAYMDPGNYATGITAGALNKFSLLFIVFLANVMAIFLQSLCIKLGTVTGYDLARCCREFLPHWLNIIIWILAECAIIATDVAEVIGSAIALNILIKVPLPAGVAITIVDVLLVLMAYKNDTSVVKFIKYLEYGIAALVFAIVICFAIELSQITASVSQVFRGYVPSKEMFEGQGLTIATSVIGATVMIHSLFLGSGLVQPRLREYDVKHGHINLEDVWAKGDGTAEVEEEEQEQDGQVEELSEKQRLVQNNEREASYFYRKYKPSYYAIMYSLKYSIWELAISLMTVALFVNSAIVVVAGSTLYGTEEAMDADLYTIHALLSKTLAPVVGTIFMLALLFSGQSAGIVCTMAGQIVSEGHINWTLKPWMRRLITRGISIIPCLFISIFIGRGGLNIALNISQVIISILLPPLMAPLFYFTCKKQFMRIELPPEMQDEAEPGTEVTKKYKDMSNSWLTTIVGALLWVFVSVLNIYAIYQMAVNGVTGG